MTLFHTLSQFSPTLHLLAGVLFFGGTGAVGRTVLQVVEVGVERSALSRLVVYPVGILVISFFVQILLFLGLYNNVLGAVLGCLVLSGGVFEFLRRKSWFRQVCAGMLRFDSALGWLVFFFALGLLVALSPSSKIDELYYHMLLPARIVADQALVYYNYPLAGAILPHMFFQLAMVPLFALNLPHAANIVGYCFGVSLAALAYIRLREVFTMRLARLLTLGLFVGLHPLVWHTTMGGHSYGELAGMLLMLLLVDSDHGKKPDAETLLLISLLSLCLVSAKISNAPVGLVCMAYVWIKGGRQLSGIWYLIVPWIAFYLPVLFFTFAHSGSPFGPLFAGWFGESSYDLLLLPKDLSDMARHNYLFDLSRKDIVNMLANYSIFTILSMVTIVFCWRKTEKYRFVILMLIGQFALMYLFLTRDLRYIGGIVYAAAVLVLCEYRQEILRYRLWFTRGLVVMIGCYLVLCGYYASQFPSPWGTAIERNRFYRDKIAYFTDLQELDKLLPEQSVILVTTHKAPLSYFPRMVIELRSPKDLLQVPSGHPAFLFSNQMLDGIYQGLQIGEKVYANNKATLAAYRDPRRSNREGSLFVYQVSMMANQENGNEKDMAAETEGQISR